MMNTYSQSNVTLSLMVIQNNKTKQPDTNDCGSEDDSNGKGLLRPVTSPVIPHLSNIIEKFEGFWARLEIKLRQSCIGQHLERDTTSKQGKAFLENYSLHWTLAEAFQDIDDEHIVKEPRKNYGESGYHAARSLNSYYR